MSANSSPCFPSSSFLRELTESHQWTRPPLRASFVLDDPNLRWPTYGFINFRSLATHATAHGYHVAIASVPLDSWPVSASAARVFVEAPVPLSLSIHGHAHLRHELERFRSVDEGSPRARPAAAANRRPRAPGRPPRRPGDGRTPRALLGDDHRGAAAARFRGSGHRSRKSVAIQAREREARSRMGARGAGQRRDARDSARGSQRVTRGPASSGLSSASHSSSRGDHGDCLKAPGPPGHGSRMRSIALERCSWTSLLEIARTNFLSRRSGSRLTVRMLCRQARSYGCPAGVSQPIDRDARGPWSELEGTLSIGDLLDAMGTRRVRPCGHLRTRVDSDTLDARHCAA